LPQQNQLDGMPMRLKWVVDDQPKMIKVVVVVTSGWNAVAYVA
jgi:hypothetical protein